ncbi:MAG: hypothetical protein OQK64_11735 [Ignavibacteriaceae bacterium]|nr:hypothetical protein [Ignavibacteriaceae bacterium]MCW8812781.1 hypothetical protein [Chlorobium sp.]
MQSAFIVLTHISEKPGICQWKYFMLYLPVSATLIWFISKDGVSYRTSNLISSNYPVV